MGQMDRWVRKLARALTVLGLIGVMTVAASFGLTEGEALWSINGFLSQNKAQDFWSILGTQLHFRDFEVNQTVAKHVRLLLKQPQHVVALSANARPYIYYIFNEAKQRGLPSIIALLPMVESDYNPNSRSIRGASGLWQLMRATAKTFGVTVNSYYDGRRDVVTSSKIAMEHLRYLHDYFHNWSLAFTAYDAGTGKVLKAIRYNKAHHLPVDFWSLNLPTETKQYVPKLLAIAYVIKHYKEYNLPLAYVPNRPFFDVVPSKKVVSIPRLAKLSNTPQKMMHGLNSAFRHQTTSPKHQPYLLVPTHQKQLILTALQKTVSGNSSLKWATHRVVRGESLSSVAARYHTRVATIQRLNKLETVLIRPGQKLLVPRSVSA